MVEVMDRSILPISLETRAYLEFEKGDVVMIHLLRSAYILTSASFFAGPDLAGISVRVDVESGTDTGSSPADSGARHIVHDCLVLTVNMPRY